MSLPMLCASSFDSNFMLPTMCCTPIADIWENSDAFHYLYASTSGDSSIEMFVKSFTGTSMDDWAKGGLMIRKHQGAKSEYFSLLVTGGKGLSNQWRSADAGTSVSHRVSDARNQNIWLKITKTGNTFQAYYKFSTGANWSTVGSSRTINFGSDSFYYGIAVTSVDTSKTAKITSSNWSSTGGSRGDMVRFIAAYFFAADCFHW